MRHCSGSIGWGDILWKIHSTIRRKSAICSHGFIQSILRRVFTRRQKAGEYELENMESPEEFMLRFLREDEQIRREQQARFTPFQAAFYAPDFILNLRRSQDVEPGTILEVLAHYDSAQVITSESKGIYRLRWRYHLQPSGDSWLIRDQDMGCPVCYNAGRAGASNCPICSGTGWSNRGGGFSNRRI